VPLPPGVTRPASRRTTPVRVLLCLGLLVCATTAAAQEVTPPGHTPDNRLLGMQPVGEGPLPGSIPAFDIEDTHTDLERLAQPDTYLDKSGRKFALLGTEAGEFEAWAWPLQLFRAFQLSFFVSDSTSPIDARDIVQRVRVRPAVTTITYIYQSFTVQAHVVAAIDKPGAVIFLDVDANHPLSIVVGFIPTMQPMWPAGLGGQYARWQDGEHAYLISESSNGNHGYIGSPAGRGLSYTPAHMLGENPNEFRIDVPDPAGVRDRFIPIVMAGGKGDRGAVTQVYREIVADPEAIYREAANHFEGLLAGTLSISTPEPTLDLALEWAKISYDNLLAENPDYSGTGLMAGLDRAGGGGRPGFGWFFGGDTYINTLSLNAMGMFDASRQALDFMTQFQREDGKMAHEVTQAGAYVDWFEDYPYAYIHADTTPWYIVAVHDLYAATGDVAMLRSHWEGLLRAYQWCLTTDIDGDGLMDNEAAGLGALEFGALTDIRTDVYLGAIWTRSLLAFSEMAREMGDFKMAGDAAARYQKASDSFEKFWSGDTGHYAYAFNAEGRTVDQVTPWSTVGIMFGLGSEPRIASTMERLSRSDLTTDWGARMLSTTSELFEPLNYNYGAVWPFITSWVSTAHFLSGRPTQGYSSLMSTVQHVFNRSLGDVTEVMSGMRHTWPQESVPHQGFATASTVLPTVRGLFGLNYRAPSDVLTFGPEVPPNWGHYSIEGFRYGSGSLNIQMTGSAGRDTFYFETRGSSSSATTLVFRPLYPAGTQVSSVSVGGEETGFETNDEPGGLRLRVSIPLSDTDRIEVRRSEEFAVVPPVWESPIGSESRGLRVISFVRNGSTAVLEVQGRSGRVYLLEAVGLHSIKSIRNALVTSTGLRIELPDSDQEYLSRAIQLEISR
jgi:Mannosylglycerate hydrolase MGH1-like glycoside hydrolase domain